MSQTWKSRVQKGAGLLALIVALAAAPNAWADGMFIPRLYQAVPEEPYQEAVILHDGEQQQVLLRVLLEPAGGPVTWLLPSPAVPTVTSADPAVFGMFAAASAPHVERRGPNSAPPFLLFLLAVSALVLVVWVRRVRSGWARVLLVLGGFGLVLVLTPVLLLLVSELDFFRPPGPTDQPAAAVRSLPGLEAFQTATFQAASPAEVRERLAESGYAVPAEAEGILESYTSRGWYFTAVRLEHPELLAAASADRLEPPALSLTYAAPDPVFPLKISALTAHAAGVELYVLAPTPVRAHGFKTLFVGGLPAWDLKHYLPGGDTALASDRFLSLTRLWAEVEPSAMEDVIMQADPGRQPFRPPVFTEEHRRQAWWFLVSGWGFLGLLWWVKINRGAKLVVAGLALFALAAGLEPVWKSRGYPYRYREGSYSSGMRVMGELEQLLDGYYARHGGPPTDLNALMRESGTVTGLENGDFVFYLSPTDYWPSASRNPYGFLFREAPELQQLGNFAPDADGYMLIGIGRDRSGGDFEIIIRDRAGDLRQVHLDLNS